MTQMTKAQRLKLACESYIECFIMEFLYGLWAPTSYVVADTVFLPHEFSTLDDFAMLLALWVEAPEVFE